MSDKEIKKNTSPKDKELLEKKGDVKEESSAQSEEFYKNTSFLRDKEELKFYKTPMIKKNHISVILGTGFALILLCIFAISNTLSFIDGIEPIEIYNKKVSDMGIYDPSLTYDSDKKIAWLAYSSIHQRIDGKSPDININVAYSNNNGKRWKFSKTVFSSKKDLLNNSNGTIPNIEGVWRYETPTILYDPDDPEKAWKVYAYKYFWTGNIKKARQYSVITLKTSPNIYTNKWSNEEWLFSADQNQPPSPYSGLVLLHLNKLHPNLKNMLYYAEPSAIYYNKSILMTLTAYKDDDKPDSIILIGSKDHGQSWLFLGTILTSKDAEYYGSYNRVDSSSLAEHKEKLYLMVSFGNEQIKYQGTHVFAFEDFTKGLLETDKSGYPTVIQHIEPPFPKILTNIGAGQSAYHEKITSGVFMPQMLSNNSRAPFNIYPMNKKIIKE